MDTNKRVLKLFSEIRKEFQLLKKDFNSININSNRIEKLELKTGKKISRSRFISLLVETTLKHQAFIDTNQIHNDQSLQEQLALAIVKGIAQK